MIKENIGNNEETATEFIKGLRDKRIEQKKDKRSIDKNSFETILSGSKKIISRKSSYDDFRIIVEKLLNVTKVESEPEKAPEDINRYLEKYTDEGFEILKNVEIRGMIKNMYYNMKFKDDNQDELKPYFDVIGNSKYYTKQADSLILLLKEKSLTTGEIRNILQDNCQKELISTFYGREELIEKNRERSKYLKRKYGKKN